MSDLADAFAVYSRILDGATQTFDRKTQKAGAPAQDGQEIVSAMQHFVEFLQERESVLRARAAADQSPNVVKLFPNARAQA